MTDAEEQILDLIIVAKKSSMYLREIEVSSVLAQCLFWDILDSMIASKKVDESQNHDIIVSTLKKVVGGLEPLIFNCTLGQVKIWAHQEKVSG